MSNDSFTAFCKVCQKQINPDNVAEHEVCVKIQESGLMFWKKN